MISPRCRSHLLKKGREVNKTSKPGAWRAPGFDEPNRSRAAQMKELSLIVKANYPKIPSKAQRFNGRQGGELTRGFSGRGSLVFCRLPPFPAL